MLKDNSSANHLPSHSFTFSKLSASPEVFPEPVVSCPGSPHQQGPVAWQTAGFPPCWWGQRPGGVPHCWGWWWSLSGGPRPDQYSQNSVKSQSLPTDPPMSALLSESLTLQYVTEYPFTGLQGCWGATNWDTAVWQGINAYLDLRNNSETFWKYDCSCS